MINERIRALIRDFNPQWEEKEIVLPRYKRHMFSEIEKYMKTRQILALVGLRRVGKTILMKQIMYELKKIKENTLYFMFDDIMAQNPDILEDIIDFYLKTIAGEGRKYIFLDEIQKVPYWQDILKRFYDMREDIKFIVSGSASLRIKKSKESLAGRIFDFYLPILTFREFLELNGIKIEKTGIDGLKEVYEDNAHKKVVLEKLFLEYIFKGAFPEIAKEEDEDIIKNYIKSSVVEKIIFEDIQEAFAIRRKDILFSILEYCGRETSNLLDITKLAGVINTNYQIVRSYLFYLKHSFLLDIVYNHSKSVAKQLRKNKKVHIAHPSITMAMMGYKRDILFAPEIISKYVETAVFQHVRCLSDRISFWRTPQKEEVDMMVDLNGLLPIEVKYQSQITRSDIKHLMKCMDMFKLKKGLIITKDMFESKQINELKILFIPAWLFMLSV